MRHRLAIGCALAALVMPQMLWAAETDLSSADAAVATDAATDAATAPAPEPQGSAAPAPAAVQTAQAPFAGETVSATDIIVTATRRAQALSDIPIAVTAIGAAVAENAGLTDLRSVNQLAPSLLVSGATSEVSFTARVRGVGTVGENPGLESSVALFIDGVYRSRTGTGMGELGQIERIEVLRGPQGTLFGRNASAGLISITTVEPQYDNEFSGQFSYGNYNNIMVEGMGNYVLSQDKAAIRLGVFFNERDGYVQDVVSDRTFNDRNRWLVRGQLRLDPTDDIHIRLIGDYSQRREECCAAGVGNPVGLRRTADGGVEQIPNTIAPIQIGLGGQIPYGELFDVAITPRLGYATDVNDWGVQANVDWTFGDVGTLTSITAYRYFNAVQGQDSDFSNLDIWGRTALDRTFKTFTQELRFQGTTLSDRLDFLGGFYFAQEALDLSDNLTFGTQSNQYGDCLVSLAISAANVNPAVPRCTNLPSAVWPGYAALATQLGASQLPGTGVGPGGYWDQRSTNWALFTHNVFAVTSNLDLTVGLRYTSETKKLDSVFNNTNNLCAALRNIASPFSGFPCAINGTAGPGIPYGAPDTKLSEGEWTGTVALAWKPTTDLMFYASWARGYKSGGYNLDTSALDPVCNPQAGSQAQRDACAAQLALPANRPFNARPEAADLIFLPEISESIEVGVKYNTGTFSANLTYFNTNFSNFQLNTFNGVNFEVTNIAGCRLDLGGTDSDGSALTGACPSDELKWGVKAQGIEADFTLVPPIDNFIVTQGVTYASTKYADNLVGTNGRPLSPVLFQLPGRQISNAPQYVVTGSASWNPPIGSKGLSGLVYLDYRLMSAINTGSDLDVEKIEQAVTVVNGKIGVQGRDNKWGLYLWAFNIFNKQYFQIGADMPLAGSGSYRAVQQGLATTANQLFLYFPAEPRTFGMTAQVNF
jgi:outer membrane receptor protein involved in Fe transport